MVPSKTWNALQGSSGSQGSCGSRPCSAGSAHPWHSCIRTSIPVPRCSCDFVDANLVLTRSVGIAARPPGSRLLRVGQSPLSSRSDLLRVIPDARRIWVQSCSPSCASCRLSDSSRAVSAVVLMWLDLVTPGSDLRSLILPSPFECTTFADACADAESVGLGGFVRLPDNRQPLFPEHLFPRSDAGVIPLDSTRFTTAILYCRVGTGRPGSSTPPSG